MPVGAPLISTRHLLSPAIRLPYAMTFLAAICTLQSLIRLRMPAAVRCCRPSGWRYAGSAHAGPSVTVRDRRRPPSSPNGQTDFRADWPVPTAASSVKSDISRTACGEAGASFCRTG